MIGHQSPGVSAVSPSDSLVTRASQGVHTLKLDEIVHPPVIACQAFCTLSRQLLMFCRQIPRIVAQYQHLMCPPPLCSDIT